MFKRIPILLASVIVASFASAQTSVTVFPDNKQLDYPSSVRIEQLSQSLLFDLNSASQCAVEWAYTSLHRVDARDRSVLLNELSNGVHPDLLGAVNAVPAHPFISLSLDYDLVRVLPEKNPVITGDYVLSRSCGRPQVLFLSYEYGAKRVNSRVRASVGELMDALDWEFRGQVTVLTPFTESNYPINTFDEQHFNAPKRAIVWLNDAPSEELNQQMIAEIKQWGALWYAQ